MITVKVDDQFWLDYAGDLVKTAVDRRDQAADKLQAYVAWLWPIFTASTALGFAFGKLKADYWLVGLIVVAQVSLILGYGACVLVRLPVDTSIVAGSPEVIMSAYTRTVESKRIRLRWALGVVVVGVILMSVSLGYASLNPPHT